MYRSPESLAIGLRGLICRFHTNAIITWIGYLSASAFANHFGMEPFIPILLSQPSA